MLPRVLANIEVQIRPDFEVYTIPTERYVGALRVDEARTSTSSKNFVAWRGDGLKVEVAHPSRAVNPLIMHLSC